jgi:hypothetical protein
MKKKVDVIVGRAMSSCMCSLARVEAKFMGADSRHVESTTSNRSRLIGCLICEAGEGEKKLGV